MARPYRLQGEEGEESLFHVASRNDARKKIFISERDFNKFLEYLNQSILAEADSYSLESALDKPIDPFKNAYSGSTLSPKEYINEKLEDSGILAAEKDVACKKTLLPHIDPDAIVNEAAKYCK